ncbi:hypothetical protein [Streptomyces sp. R44]|uniref:Uncharacterized protein n=1 Tax=Streptomyces sp. R44 TaxID=3238633 RepID=A0AB39T6H4_9ACTN
MKGGADESRGARGSRFVTRGDSGAAERHEAWRRSPAVSEVLRFG